MRFDLVDLQLFIAVARFAQHHPRRASSPSRAGVGQRIAVVPEAAARRCARSMPIAIVGIRDPWANRRLVICARSFKSMPRPAKQLVDFLREAAQD